MELHFYPLLISLSLSREHRQTVIGEVSMPYSLLLSLPVFLCKVKQRIGIAFHSIN